MEYPPAEIIFYKEAYVRLNTVLDRTNNCYSYLNAEEMKRLKLFLPVPERDRKSFLKDFHEIRKIVNSISLFTRMYERKKIPYKKFWNEGAYTMDQVDSPISWRTLSWPDKLPLLNSIAYGLLELWDSGYYYDNFSPGNILINAQQEVKVCSPDNIKQVTPNLSHEDVYPFIWIIK